MNLGLGPLRDAEEQRNYVNFYGNLIKAADAALVEVLDTLEETGLLEDTLIVRTSDHGEMGMAHGGMRQKSFNVYEESLRVRRKTSASVKGIGNDEGLDLSGPSSVIGDLQVT